MACSFSSFVVVFDSIAPLATSLNFLNFIENFDGICLNQYGYNLSKGICEQCDAGKFYYLGKCLSGCPYNMEITYDLYGKKSCKKCSDNQFSYNNICYDECPLGTIKDIILKICIL